MHPSYFGHDEFADYAPSLKTIADGEARAAAATPRLAG
jgi:hypothetical protein